MMTKICEIKIGHTIMYHDKDTEYDKMIGVVTSIRGDMVYADWGEPHCGNVCVDISQVSIIVKDWDE